MTMEKRLFTIVLALVLLFGATSLWARGGQESAAKAKVIKVGYTAPFTGSAAEFGTNGWLGVQLMLTNGGACYLPARMAEPLIAAGRLYAVADAPRYPHPAYMVYPKEFDNPVMLLALEGLRTLSRSA